MKKHFYSDDCISYEQLQWYIAKNISKEEYNTIYLFLPFMCPISSFFSFSSSLPLFSSFLTLLWVTRKQSVRETDVEVEKEVVLFLQ